MADRCGEEQLVCGYDGRLFVGISLGWCMIVFGRQLLPPLLPAIIEDLAISSFLAGIALTSLLAMRAINQYPGGRLSDQLSRKTVLVSSLLVATLGFVLLSSAIVYPVLLLAISTVGIGAGAYSVSTRTTTADLYVKKRGRAFGIQGAFTSIAGVASAGTAVVVLAVGTWRSGFLPIAALLVTLVLALHRWNHDSYVVKRVELGLIETGWRVFGTVRIRWVVAAYILCLFAWMGLIGFLPTFLHVEKNLSTALASAGFGLVYLVGVIAGPLAGVIGDLYGKLPTAIVAVGFGLIGMFALMTAESVLCLTVIIIMISSGFWAFFPVVQAYLMDSFDDDTMGGDLGAVKTVWGLAGSLGPTYVGLVADWRSYTLAFIGLGLCLVGGLAIVARVWSSNRSRART